LLVNATIGEEMLFIKGWRIARPSLNGIFGSQGQHLDTRILLRTRTWLSVGVRILCMGTWLTLKRYTYHSLTFCFLYNFFMKSNFIL